MLESWCELIFGLRLLLFRGMSLLCLGDEFRGVDAGLEDLAEPARNLSRKCCSQSAEGIMWFCFVLSMSKYAVLSGRRVDL